MCTSLNEVHFVRGVYFVRFFSAPLYHYIRSPLAPEGVLLHDSHPIRIVQLNFELVLCDLVIIGLIGGWGVI